MYYACARPHASPSLQVLLGNAQSSTNVTQQCECAVLRLRMHCNIALDKYFWYRDRRLRTLTYVYVVTVHRLRSLHFIR